jgi:hypothetical protein
MSALANALKRSLLVATGTHWSVRDVEMGSTKQLVASTASGSSVTLTARRENGHTRVTSSRGGEAWSAGQSTQDLAPVMARLVQIETET